jgi:hypothetical protein
MRHDCQVYIELNLPQAIYNNIPFYISKNKVILSPGIEGIIPANFIKLVTDKKGSILHKQQYESLIHIDFEKGFIRGFSILDLNNGKIIKSEENINIELDEFVETGIDGDVRKRPCVVTIDKDKISIYEAFLTNNFDKIKYIGFFSEYIPISQDNAADNFSGVFKIKDTFNSANLTKVKINKKNKEKEKNSDNKKVIGLSKNPDSKKSDEFKLTRETLKNPNIEKNYLLLFLNYEEVDILTSIDCIMIPNSDINKFKSYTYTLEIKPIKVNLTNFLDELKKFLEENVIII